MKSFQDKDLQSFIGNLLRIGVVISMTILIAGLVLYLFQNGKNVIHYETFNEKNTFHFADFWASLKSGDSEAIMELGIMALISTPIARVLFTMIGFWMEKDRLYTIIAMTVLLIITFSLVFGITSH
jgi:uncharacterized membrane protein